MPSQRALGQSNIRLRPGPEPQKFQEVPPLPIFGQFCYALLIPPVRAIQTSNYAEYNAVWLYVLGKEQKL